MLFKNITIIDENFDVRKNMYVGVKDGVIACVTDTAPEEDFGEIYEGKDRLLIPAFYNAHSHLPMFLLRGYGEDLQLMDWLQGKIFPFEAHLTPEDMYYSTLTGIAEMLRFGIAGTTEMYLNYEPLGRAFAETGVKTNFSSCVMCFDDSDYKDLPVYAQGIEAHRKFAGDPLVRPMISLHAEYTSNEKIARAVAETAAELGSTMHIHVSETKSEVEECRARHGGRSPVRYLADCGLFDVPAVAAHCVHIDDDDIAILKEHGVSVATCPKSNAKLASGVCPVKKLLGAGVNVALGTDSVASNNSLNIIEEMRMMNLMQRAVSLDPVAVTTKQTLYAATRAGALAQQREDCGLIKEGFRADLTVLDTDKAYMKPDFDTLANLVYSSCGSDVLLTMVDGKVLYKEGTFPTIDLEKAAFESERSRRRILAELANA